MPTYLRPHGPALPSTLNPDALTARSLRCLTLHVAPCPVAHPLQMVIGLVVDNIQNIAFQERLAVGHDALEAYAKVGGCTCVSSAPGACVLVESRVH